MFISLNDIYKEQKEKNEKENKQDEVINISKIIKEKIKEEEEER